MPPKVVTCGPNCTELFVALGLEQYVIGRTNNDHAQTPLKEYAQAYNAISQLCYSNPTIEAMVSSGCDFLYVTDNAVKGDFTVAAVGAYDINAYVSAATSVDEVYKEIRDIGKIFGVEEKAEEYITDQQKRVEAVQAAVKGQKPLKVFCYDNDAGNGSVYTASGANIENELIKMSGGANIFESLDKAWISVSLEEILAAEPDAIIIHDYSSESVSPSSEKKIETIKSDPILSQLDCVKNDRFIVLPLIDVLPGIRTADYVETIFKGLYPNY